jgi:hypothetical protein
MSNTTPIEAPKTTTVSLDFQSEMLLKLKTNIPSWFKYRLFIHAALRKFVPGKDWILDENLTVIRFVASCSFMTIVYRVIRKLIEKLRKSRGEEKPAKPCKIEYMLSAALASIGLMIMAP